MKQWHRAGKALTAAVLAALVCACSVEPPKNEAVPASDVPVSSLKETAEDLLITAEEEPREPQEGVSKAYDGAEQINESLGREIDITKKIKSPVVTLSNKSAALGEVLRIYAENTGGSAVTATTDFGFTPVFYPDADGRQSALLAFPYSLQPGDYKLTVKIGEKAFPFTIKAAEREFIIQHLTISESTASSTNTAAANLEWEEKIEPLKLEGDDEKYWNGPFIQPVQGEITTEYGCTRYTNGSTIPSRHSGIDIAAKAGTPVPASGNGRVQFAGFLQLTGYTVVIEHGHGLKSFYYHMQSVAVETGDMVKQGQQIGAVGSTGYSTGPHLHYAMTVRNVFVNPWTAFATGFEE